ncbi:cupin domain-containing protein [Chitinophaga sp. GCM10012297]|uniref:Cupin domain-containing protein n=1 Tax=Chitinophaga chungangae TaxID=2821488 RepID=A0ABS3YEJ4_9BACT|nr:cupin domain-containing protein [Chitinophaga chungangae]MBO9152544.1 cupin domain-containing protein [Chitinophaga chungangae]
MIRPGSVFYNPHNREQITFLHTHASSNGAYLRIAAVVGAGGEQAGGALRHFHPLQEEKFIVHSGLLCMYVKGGKKIFKAGDTVVIPAGVPHRWRNCSYTEPLHFTYEIAPAMQWEMVIETLWALAQKGAVRENGSASFLQLAVTLDHFREHFYFAGLPVPLQRVIFRLGAVIGRKLGLKPHHKYRGVDGL